MNKIITDEEIEMIKNYLKTRSTLGVLSVLKNLEEIEEKNETKP